MNAPGKGLLKVTGIFKIIYGSLLVLGSIYLIIYSIISTREFYADPQHVGFSLSPLFTAAGIIGLVCSPLELVMGILGVRRSGKPGKNTACFVLAIIDVALVSMLLLLLGPGVFFFAVLFISTSSLLIISIISYIIICLTLHILYLVGVAKNRKAASLSSAILTE